MSRGFENIYIQFHVPTAMNEPKLGNSMYRVMESNRKSQQIPKLNHFNQVSQAFFTLFPLVSGRPKTDTTPTIQAGHHTHHTTTGVYVPVTSHANAACLSTSPNPYPTFSSRPGSPLATNTTVVGDKTYKTTIDNHLRGELGQGRTNVRGALKTPTRKASEKLRVASEERNMPSRRREKERMR